MIEINKVNRNNTAKNKSTENLSENVEVYDRVKDRYIYHLHSRIIQSENKVANSTKFDSFHLK